MSQSVSGAAGVYLSACLFPSLSVSLSPPTHKHTHIGLNGPHEFTPVNGRFREVVDLKGYGTFHFSYMKSWSIYGRCRSVEVIGMGRFTVNT